MPQRKVYSIEITDSRANDPRTARGPYTNPLKPKFSFEVTSAADAPDPDAMTWKKIGLAVQSLNLTANGTENIVIFDYFPNEYTYTFLVKTNEIFEVHTNIEVPPSYLAYDKIDVTCNSSLKTFPDIDNQFVQTALEYDVFADITDEKNKTEKSKAVRLNLNLTPVKIPIDSTILPVITKMNSTSQKVADLALIIASIKTQAEAIQTTILATRQISANAAIHCNQFSQQLSSFTKAIQEKTTAFEALQKQNQQLLTTITQQYYDSFEAQPAVLLHPRIKLVRSLQLSALSYFRELLVKPPLTKETVASFNEQFTKIASIDDSKDIPVLVLNSGLLYLSHGALSECVNNALNKFYSKSSSALIRLTFSVSRPRDLFKSFLETFKIEQCKLKDDKTFSWVWYDLGEALKVEIVGTEREFNKFETSVTQLSTSLTSLLQKMTELQNTVNSYAKEAKKEQDELERIRADISTNAMNSNVILDTLVKNYNGIDAQIEFLQQALASLIESAKTITGQYAGPATSISRAKISVTNILSEAKISERLTALKDVKSSATKITAMMTELTSTNKTYETFNKGVSAAITLAEQIETEIDQHKKAVSKEDMLILAMMKIASLFEEKELSYWQQMVTGWGGTKLDVGNRYVVPHSVSEIFVAKQKLTHPLEYKDAEIFYQKLATIVRDADERGSYRFILFRVRSKQLSELLALVRDINLDAPNLGMSNTEFDTRLDRIKPDWHSKFNPLHGLPASTLTNLDLDPSVSGRSDEVKEDSRSTSSISLSSIATTSSNSSSNSMSLSGGPR
jgi:Mg2+ and Co2+ transporter CorA